MTPSLQHWHTHNRFELLVDSREFFPAMLSAIQAAQHTIYFEQYLVASGLVLDEFITALLASAASGVRIYLLFDDYGTKGISEHDRQRLRNAGIRLEFYNPFKWSQLYRSMRRNHRKLLLIDNQVAFVGGACISDEYRVEDPPSHSWHDTVVKIEGEVVQDWRQSFLAMWEKTVRNKLQDDKPASAVTEHQPGRIALANGPGKNQILRHAIAQIKKSRKIIWIATPYFVITLKMRHALKRAARRGVDVRLLLPGDITDQPWITHAARRYYSRLLKNKVRIYEYQPRFIHAKLIISDEWVSIGSSNLDRWNHFWNLDANQEIWHDDFADRVRELFEQDFAQSRLIDADAWRRRPWRQRLNELISNYKIRLIQWLAYFATWIKKKAD
jgi:phosphatidylserine/phosphatidylglycerophosphate/cardiolipin synthase-like enzyme